MPDFHQNGIVTTMHDLGTTDRDRLENLLAEATKDYKIGLVLPVTSSDMRAAPFREIIRQLQGATYIDTIAVVLGAAPGSEGQLAAHPLPPVLHVRQKAILVRHGISSLLR